MAGTAHDLTAHPGISGPTDPCKFCHAGTEPYKASSNRTDINKTFTLFSSMTMQLSADQPGPSSRFCMSCHDGETAFDAFHGEAGTPGNDMQTIFPGSESVIGLDLSDFHPVGLDLTGDLNGITTLSAIEASGLPLINGKMECVTCHDSHGESGHVSLLRIDPANSQLCLVCHVK